MIHGPVATGMPQGPGPRAAMPMPATALTEAFAVIVAKLEPRVEAPAHDAPAAHDAASAGDDDPAEDDLGDAIEPPEGFAQNPGGPKDAAPPAAPAAALSMGQVDNRPAATMPATAVAVAVADGGTAAVEVAARALSGRLPTDPISPMARPPDGDPGMQPAAAADDARSGRAVPDLAPAAGPGVSGSRGGAMDVQRTAVPSGLPAAGDPGSIRPPSGAAAAIGPALVAALPPVAGAAPPMQIVAGSSRRASADPAPPASAARAGSPQAHPGSQVFSAPSARPSAIARPSAVAAATEDEIIRATPDMSALVAVPGSERPGASAAAPPPGAPPPPAAPAAAQIAAAVSALGNGRTEIVLAPVELGRVTVTLAMQDGTMSVAIVAERDETTDLIRRNLDQLMQEFRELGYDDVSFRFGSGSGDDGAAGAVDTEGPAPPDPPDAGDHTLPGHATAIGRMDLRL